MPCFSAIWLVRRRALYSRSARLNAKCPTTLYFVLIWLFIFSLVFIYYIRKHFFINIHLGIKNNYLWVSSTWDLKRIICGFRINRINFNLCIFLSEFFNFELCEIASVYIITSHNPVTYVRSNWVGGPLGIKCPRFIQIDLAALGQFIKTSGTLFPKCPSTQLLRR